MGSLNRVPVDRDSPVSLVVGYDDHPASHRALQVAVGLAERLGASLEVVHVVQLNDFPIDPDAQWDESIDGVLTRQRRDVQARLSETAVAHTFHAVRGDPAHALGAVAEERDALMIVVGVSSVGLMGRLIRTEVPRSLARHQRRPVLVVPDQDHGPRSDHHSHRADTGRG